MMLARSRLTTSRIRRIQNATSWNLSKSSTPSPSISSSISSRAALSHSATSYLQSQSSHAAQSGRTIAVLGGGISGLATALYLRRALSNSKAHLSAPWKIVLIEKENRLGGWVESQRIPITQGKNTAETALLESGPRSLRPAGYSGLVMLELIKSLNLLPRLLKVPKSAPSAKNRFIYYPNSLAKLPSSPLSALSALRLPVLKGLIPSLLSEAFVPSRFSRPKSESALEINRQREREAFQDESVHDFLTRRFGNRSLIPENLVSAVLHGIYAGDSRKLSVRSVLPFLWNTEKKSGSLIRAILPTKWNKRFREPTSKETERDEAAAKELKAVENRLGEEFVKEMKNISVYSFPEGIEEITIAMRHELDKDENVEIWSGTESRGIAPPDESGKLRVQTSSGDLLCDRIISALPSSTLSSILDPDSLPSQASTLLSYNPASNVGVINVAISSSEIPPGKRLLGPIEGFGYLVPRSTPGNKDGILGVVFDSDALPDQDKKGAEDSNVPTKFTVMMGGTTYWPSSKSSIDSNPESTPSLPAESDLKQAAIRALSNQLGIEESILNSQNTVIKVQLQKNAIPQYLVGHPVRMKTLHDLLSKPTANGKTWGSHLTLVGASYTGVSLNDCVAHAEKTVRRLLESRLEGNVTGLEEFESLS